MIVILGRGGHAKVLEDCCEALRRFNGNPKTWRSKRIELGEPVPRGSLLVGVGDMTKRRELFDAYEHRRFIMLRHPSAVLPCDFFLGMYNKGIGIQIMAGAIIQPGCKIGNNVLINTRASVDHDCIIGDHVHIAPGAILCGGVTVGEGAFIGAGAIIPEGRVVPAGAFVKAGSVFG